jgi:hypothetical protein
MGSSRHNALEVTLLLETIPSLSAPALVLLIRVWHLAVLPQRKDQARSKNQDKDVSHISVERTHIMAKPGSICSRVLSKIKGKHLI